MFFGKRKFTEGEWYKIFKRKGQYSLSIKYYGNTYDISLDDLYQLFKSRLIDEEKRECPKCGSIRSLEEIGWGCSECGSLIENND